MNEDYEKKDIIDSIYSFQDEKSVSWRKGASVQKKKRWFLKNNSVLYIVVILGIASVFVGSFGIYKRIQKPYDILGENQSKKVALDSLSADPNDSLHQALIFDTDNDGLSDSDENTIYYTSPYLEDTDSDGMSDYEEITKGTDPNCLLGTKCDGEARPKDSQGDADSLLQAQVDIGSVPTPQYLREILKKSGVDAKLYESLSDEELIREYNKVLGGYAEVNNQATKATDIKSISPQKLREFLLQNGMSQELIDKFSDEEIRQILEETVQSQ